MKKNTYLLKPNYNHRDIYFDNINLFIPEINDLKA